MLDADLVILYGVATKRLNEQAKRNLNRFPTDFMFQLTQEEKEDVVANCDHLKNLKYSHTLPYAFPDSWRNMLIFGDNLLALKTLYEDQRGPNKYGTKNKIKLIYIDPPFATKQDFMKDREKAYRDKIIGAQFIEFLRKRLLLLREVLADDGSIYVHLDYKKGHYIKNVLDEIFGEYNFLCE